MARMDYPRIAADLAAQTDDLFFGGFGVLLDYSPASILALDAFFADLYGLQGDSPETDAYQPSTGKQKIIIGVGCYFGETLRRLFGGQWREDPKNPGNPLWTQLDLPGDYHVFPITRVFKRFKNGAEEDLFSLFVAMRQKLAPAGLPGEAESFFRQAERFAACGPGQAGAACAPQFYEYAIKLDPVYATKPRWQAPSKPPPLPARAAAESPREAPRQETAPGLLLLVDPPFPRAEPTADQYRAAGEMFERAGMPDIAQRFFARGPRRNRG